MTAHARLSPSNLRWPHCPGSVREEARYPDVAGEAAIDGTGSHLLLELCLSNDVTPDQYDGHIIGANHPEKPDGWMVSADRIERVQMCLSYIARRRRELSEEFTDAVITVQEESSSDPGGMFGRDDWYGTADVTITVMKDGQCLFVEIIDYKDGRGWVDVEGNTQLISYAGGKVRPFIASGPQQVRPFRPENVSYGVRVAVVQPKTQPPVRYQDYTTLQLVNALEQLSLAAMRTDQPDAPLENGPHCQWCKFKPDCPAQSEKSLEVLKMETTEIVSTGGESLFELVQNVIHDVEDMTSARLAELADARAGIEAAFDRVEAELTSRLEQGQQVDGYALKPGRATRVWNEDEDTIVKMLRNRKLKSADIYPPKLASPAQIEKNANLTPEQKEKIIREYVTTKAGTLKLTRVERASAVEVPFMDMVEAHQKEVAQDTTNVLPSFL